MGAKIKFMNILGPALPFLPEVEAPDRKIPFQQKVLWSAMALAVFLICCQIPLYGINTKSSNDPFYWLRVILASNRGTLMELGISPLVTSSMVLQFLAGSKIIEIDQNIKNDRVLFSAAQKLAGIIFTVVQAAFFCSSGMYGKLTPGATVMIVGQLTVASIIVMLLDELLQKGHGIGSGISLFIATNICETVAWKAMSPAKISTPNGDQFEGAIISFFHQFFFSSNKLNAIKEAFYRPYGPNLMNLVVTLMIFALVVYFQGFRVDLNVKSNKMRGQTGNYPIRLFYTSTMPIILQSALISNLYFFSQLLYKRFKNNMLVNLLGQWQEVEYIGEQIPVGGLAYYISPPMSVWQFVTDPFRSFVYCAFAIGTCGFLSKAWIDVSGEAPRDVAKRLRDQQLVIAGYRDVNLVSVLNKYIPPCAQVGGCMIAMLTIVADLLGCIGSGTGMLLAVTITYSYFEQFAKQQD